MNMKEDECLGCRNIREKNFPIMGYSHVRNCYLMRAEGWMAGDKPKTLIDVYYCPVCGNELRKFDNMHQV